MINCALLRSAILLLLEVVFVVATFVVHAQTPLGPETLPPTVQPGLLPASVPTPPPATDAQPRFVLPSVQHQTDVDNERTVRDQVRFPVTRILIGGSTVYSAKTLRRYTRTVNGHKASLETLQQLAERLTQRYQRDGYVLSRVIVPPQHIEIDPQRPGYGVVRLQALEGYLHQMNFLYGHRANRLRTTAIEQATRQRLQNSRPLRVQTLERSLLLLQDTPGVSVQALVRASSQPGTADADIILGYKPVQGYVQLDNRTARYFGPVQLSAGIEASDIFCDGGRLSLRAAGASGLSFGEAAYNHPLITTGPLAGLEGHFLINASKSRPGKELEVFDIHGRSRRLAVGLSYPLVRARANTLRLRADLTADSVSSKALGSELFDDEVRAVRFGADWTGSDRRGGTNNASIEAVRGLDAFGAAPAGAGNRSRAGAGPNFLKISFNAGREQMLSALFPKTFPDTSASGSRSVYLGLAGQWANEPLLASEEFGLGGASFLSAYDPNSAAGDKGLALRLEVRRTMTLLPDENSLLLNWLHGTTQQQYVFSEAGAVRNLRTTGAGAFGAEASDAALASAGFGWRWLAADSGAFTGWSAALEVAQPVTTGTTGTIYEDNSPRAFFRVSKTF